MIEHVGTPARGETDLTQSAPLPRWVLARTSSRAHLASAIDLRKACACGASTLS